MEVYGHRGAAGLCAENTIASMQKALESGVDGIEFDVRLARDGVPVVIHDETLDRTTNLTGRVDSFTAIELKSGTTETDHPNEFVPSLISVLEAIGTETAINVELKEHAATEPTRNVLLAAIEQQIIHPGQILVTSFDHQAIEFYRSISDSDDHQFATGLLTKGIPQESYWALARKLGVSSANIDVQSVDAEFVGRAHAEQLRAMVYTVNTGEESNRLRELGVDAIFTDFPNRVRG